MDRVIFAADLIEYAFVTCNHKPAAQTYSLHLVAKHLKSLLVV